MGIAGGKPNLSYYFASVEGPSIYLCIIYLYYRLSPWHADTQLGYLDPHFCRPIVEYKAPERMTEDVLCLRAL